jgi:hypothetical protein
MRTIDAIGVKIDLVAPVGTTSRDGQPLTIEIGGQDWSGNVHEGQLYSVHCLRPVSRLTAKPGHLNPDTSVRAVTTIGPASDSYSSFSAPSRRRRTASARDGKSACLRRQLSTRASKLGSAEKIKRTDFNSTGITDVSHIRPALTNNR